jgi:hypothetical protein
MAASCISEELNSIATISNMASRLIPESRFSWSGRGQRHLSRDTTGGTLLETKTCAKCGLEKSQSDYSLTTARVDGSRPFHSRCKPCRAKDEADRAHKAGIRRPMSEAKDSPMYLGIYVAERALSKFFNNITRMPHNNPGYDFLCGKGFKIDVKSACLHQFGNREPSWAFSINNNTIADYFLCIGFKSRSDLEPLRVWLIPGAVINDHGGFCITNIPRILKKWEQYEHPLEKVIACCAQLREVSYG